MRKSPPTPPYDIETAHGGRRGRPSSPSEDETAHGGRNGRLPPASPPSKVEAMPGGHKGQPSDIESAAAHGHRKNRSRAISPPPRFTPPLPKLWKPWLVPFIFVVNVALFLYSMYANNCPANITMGRECLLGDVFGRFSFQPFKENPLLGPSTITLQNLGALQKKLVVEGGEEWRLFTCMFLHAGIIHLVANMFSLLSIGIRLEQEFGFVRIGPLYVLSGFAGSMVSILRLKSTAKPTISVGASGALFGLLGAMLSELLTNWTIYENKCAALITLLAISALNLCLGFLPRVDNSAHVGGFITGFLLGFVFLMRPQYGYVSRKHIPPGYDVERKSKFTLYQYIFFFGSSIILVIGYILVHALIRRNTDKFWTFEAHANSEMISHAIYVIIWLPLLIGEVLEYSPPNSLDPVK